MPKSLIIALPMATRRASHITYIWRAVMPTFTLDTRGKTDAVLTAHKVAQQFHRDQNIKTVLEIAPHELSLSDLAATKKSTVKTC